MSEITWETVHEAPPALQTHRGARLSLAMIIEVVDQAHVFGGDDSPNLGLGQAWAAFEASHHIEGDLWVDGAPAPKKEETESPSPKKG